MKRHIAIGAAIGIVAGIVVVAALRTGGGPGSPGTVRVERFLMGTAWSIEVVHPPGEERAALEAVGEAFREVDRIEAIMSEWRDDSPISRVNDRAGQGPTPAPPELVAIVRRALELGRRSDGAFDITWGGLGALWRFDDDAVLPPDPTAIDAALARVGYDRVVVTDDSIELPVEGMALGLGGIAKGYAIDRAGAVLRAAGYDDFFVDGGGDVLLSGQNRDRPWRVGVRHPRRSQELLAWIETDGGAVVTSGDYYRFREVDGVRYHHIIDLRTGWPATGCQSVTIVAASAETADALATAVFVLGPEDGLRLVEETADTEALLVTADGQILTTTHFEQSGTLL